MLTHDEIIQRVNSANPVVDESDVSDELLADITSLITEGRQVMTDVDTPREQGTTNPIQTRRWLRPALAFAVAFAMVLLVGATALVFGGGDAPADTTVPPTTEPATPTTEATPPTTEATPSTTSPIPDAEDAWVRVGADVMGTTDGLFDIARFGAGIVAVGWDNGANQRPDGAVFVSTDETSWAQVGEDAPELSQGAVLLYGVTEGGPGIVIVGAGCEDDDNPCPLHATVWTSTNGTSWNRSAPDSDTFPVLSSMLDVVNTSSGFIAVGSTADLVDDEIGVFRPAVWRSDDAIDWTLVWQGESITDSSNSPFFPGIHSLTVNPDGVIVAVGAATNANGELAAAVWSSTNQADWQRASADSPAFGTGTIMSSVAWADAGYVAVGTDDGEAAALWHSNDGDAWTRIDTADQPFEDAGSLGAVARIQGGFIAIGPDMLTEFRTDWVTMWTSPDGLNWDRVQELENGSAHSVLTVDTEIAVAGVLDTEASVWIGPPFDPAAPPPG